MDRAQLADFLRARREALRPADVGLGPGARGRSAGLRPEEVAALATMPTEHYAGLEEQRAPQPSPVLLLSLARALRLTPDERDHLFRLAGRRIPERHTASEQVSPVLLRMLDRLDDTPAQVLTDLGETLAQNRLARALFGDFEHRTGAARSAVHRWFTEPGARSAYPVEERREESRALVAELRAALVRRGQDPRSRALVARLRAESDEFAGIWADHEVGVLRGRRRRISHPEVGMVELDCQALVDESRSQVLAVFTAAPGTQARRRLELLSGAGARFADR
ncbi:helix-turn-helix domain-containing protein [Streptomyces liangshanensis]|uniref:Helix-turn-helix domain-containing protein n=1 Tax=Streptomyces liangshanensis TaxID=2717324 RepID=A0A6G9H8D1_9ACTN|nr:helix-turn-helix domain-containing protein [Streptomyces liangshanensis]QIQ06471.1 helix-turn-helix domain-containing protein [Streptomyces liangshanensis]